MKKPVDMSEALATLKRLEQSFSANDFTEKVSEPIHAALIASMRQKRIPKDTGALAKSLLDRSDRAHIFDVDPQSGEIQYGSKLPQAKYQSDKLGKPDASVVREAIAGAVRNILRGE